MGRFAVARAALGSTNTTTGMRWPCLAMLLTNLPMGAGDRDFKQQRQISNCSLPSFSTNSGRSLTRVDLTLWPRVRIALLACWASLSDSSRISNRITDFVFNSYTQNIYAAENLAFCRILDPVLNLSSSSSSPNPGCGSFAKHCFIRDINIVQCRLN